MSNIKEFISELCESKVINEIKLRKTEKCAAALEKTLDENDDVDIYIKKNKNGVSISIKSTLIEFFHTMDLFREVLHYSDNITCSLQSDGDDVVLSLNIDNVFIKERR